MELTAWGCRAARTVHKPVQMQSPGSLVSYLNRLAQSRWGSVPASSSGPTDPVLRANLFLKLQIRLADFPELYCPIDQRLQAVHLGDLLRLWVRPEVRVSTRSPDFQGPVSATPDAAPDAALYGAAVPISDPVGFRQTRPLQRKDNSSQGSGRRFWDP